MVVEERNLTFDEYKTLRHAVGWKLTEEYPTTIALENSLYSVVVLDCDRVVGTGRVIGDGGLYYYVQDLLVHPDYQGKGYGNDIMSKLMDYIKGHAVSGSIIGLMSAPGLEHFYIKHGFINQPENGTGMFKFID